MSSLVIVGAQWGDEGKGKIVDALAGNADMVVRFQGGDNAGHTVYLGDQKYVLHILPSGIIRPEVMCVIGSGVVVNPFKLLAELEEVGVPEKEWADRLRISSEAHMILPCHVAMDRAIEENLGDGKIGTTLRGIGPAYADRAARVGVRMGDMLDETHLRDRLSRCFAARKPFLSDDEFKANCDLDAAVSSLRPVMEKTGNLLCDTSLVLAEARARGDNILFEGAQGTMLDVGVGTYPFVTSSHTVSGSVAVGSGLGPHCMDRVYGIVKAYTTRVGEGPFPTELDDDTGQKLRDVGGEYGATTGRPRRCGWIDLVSLKRAVRLNSLDGMIVTKLDVLDEFDEIGLCKAYDVNGEHFDEWPHDPSLIGKVRPVFDFVPGWRASTSVAGSYSELPEKAREYIELLEQSLGIPVVAISAGKDRSQLIIRGKMFD